MSKIIGTYDAKTKFSQVIQEVSDGERYVVTRNGKKVAEIIPYQKCGKRRRGSMKGLVTYMAPDFNDTPEEFADYM